jgi:mRNA interferase HigB
MKMRVISVKRLRQFWQQKDYRDSEQALRAWYAEARKANWKGPHEIKAQYRSASIVGNDRVVFNICGNKYRLVVALKYDFGIVFVKFIGTHKQYDRINVEEI